MGPIFDARAGDVTGRHPDRFEVITGGFAAVEAEFVFRLAADAPAGKAACDLDEAASLVESLCVGIEFAGSPLPLINVLGPAVVVSDFGNNAGLGLGPCIPGWREMSIAMLHCETFIDGVRSAPVPRQSITGGSLAALAFALARCAQRGLPLMAGMYVTTGAATGIHDIRAGQHARIGFGRFGDLRVHAVAAGGTAREPSSAVRSTGRSSRPSGWRAAPSPREPRRVRIRQRPQPFSRPPMCTSRITRPS